MLITNLDNGIKVVIESNKYVNSANLGILVKSGSIYESFDKIGISHFIEHMLFKGTTNRTNRDIAEEIDFIGGQINAFTTKEHTCLYSKVPFNHLTLAVDILSDMLMHPLFSPSEIEKEKKVIIEEIKMYNDLPEDIVFEMMSKVMFKNNPLSYPILGVDDSVKNINYNNIIEYYNERYTPENIVITISGNVNIDDAIFQLNEKFSEFTNKHNNLTENLIINYENNKKLEIEGVRKKTEQLHLCFALPYCGSYSEDYFTGLLVNNYIGGSMSSVLYQTVREELGLAYEIESSVETYKEAGALEIYVALDATNASNVLEIICRVLNDLKDNNMSYHYIEKFKGQLIGNHLLSVENPFNKMYDNGKELLDIGNVIEDSQILKSINDISIDSVSRFIDKYFNNNKKFITYVGNIKNKSKFESKIIDILN
ncbi:MAG: insulinase family protein [Tissierellales bacterium]|nr:insulinase family protein [Tissierellales bacterium]